MKKMIKGALVCAVLLATLLLSALPAAALTPVHSVSDAYRSSPYYQNLLSLELTGDQRTDLILVALSQLGYHEGNGDAELHGLSTDGSRNFAEYNRLHGKVDNGEGSGVSYGYYWCCSFATWCARQAGIPKSIMPSEISCWRLIDNHLKPMGIYHPVAEGYIPIAGDYIFFRGEEALRGAPADHIGIVLYVDGKTVWTVEGNSIYDSVAVRSYELTDPYIVGYASPDYVVDESMAMDFNPRTGGYRLHQANYFITATKLNVRSGSGVGYDSIGQLAYGDTVVLQAVQGNWGRIDFHGREGWISLSYVQYVPIPVNDAPPSVSIVFEAGSTVIERKTLTQGDEIALPELPNRTSANPDIYLWAPDGWDSNGDSLADLYPGEVYTAQEDQTLSAVYSRTPTPYPVRFYGADGILVEEQLCPFGTLPTPPDMSQYAPEDGRIFDGWDSVIIAVMGEMEYHAVYLPAPTRYTVRFWSDDGRLLLEQLLPEGEMPTPPPDSELVRDDGSTFLGWDAEIVPATADAEYRTVYKWNINHGTDGDPPPDDSTGTPKTPPSLPVVLLSCAGVLLLLAALWYALRQQRLQD